MGFFEKAKEKASHYSDRASRYAKDKYIKAKGLASSGYKYAKEIGSSALDSAGKMAAYGGTFFNRVKSRPHKVKRSYKKRSVRKSKKHSKKSHKKNHKKSKRSYKKRKSNRK